MCRALPSIKAKRQDGVHGLSLVRASVEMPVPIDKSLGLRHGERGPRAEGAAGCANRRLERKWGFERWLKRAGKLIYLLCGRLPGPDYCYPGQLDTRMEDDADNDDDGDS